MTLFANSSRQGAEAQRTQRHNSQIHHAEAQRRKARREEERLKYRSLKKNRTLEVYSNSSKDDPHSLLPTPYSLTPPSSFPLNNFAWRVGCEQPANNESPSAPLRLCVNFFEKTPLCLRVRKIQEGENI